MAEDFFAELGETITKTAKDIGSKADGFFESQKIRTKIMSEQRMIDKSLADMGNIIYQKYVDGGAIDEELLPLCEDITQRKVAIAKFREDVAKMKGQKVCAACGATVPSDAAFCMQCGAPCKSEPEEECNCKKEESCCCEEQEAEEVKPEDVQEADTQEESVQEEEKAEE